MIFGYARVSSVGQNLARQIKDLEDFGCERIYQDKLSGKDFQRASYLEMRSKMRFGDVLVVHDLSRFGRNKQEIKNEWESLIKDEIDIVVLDMPILDTRRYKQLEGVGQLITELVLSLLSWMVEDERRRSKVAQSQGIAIAKQNNVYKGGKRRYHADAKGTNKLIYDEIVRGLRRNDAVMDIARKVNVSRGTVYKIRQELENEKGVWPQ